MRNFGPLLFGSQLQGNVAQPELKLIDESIFTIFPFCYVGTLQVDTAVAAGNVTADGNAVATVTGAGITGSPVAVNFAVLNGDTPAVWAAKAVAAINANVNIAALYVASAVGANIALTRKVAAADDATLNLALATGTATGITAAPTSANTVAGAATGVGLTVNIEMQSPNGDWHVVGTLACTTAGPQAPLHIEQIAGAIRSRISGWTVGNVTVTGVKTAY